MSAAFCLKQDQQKKKKNQQLGMVVEPGSGPPRRWYVLGAAPRPLHATPPNLETSSIRCPGANWRWHGVGLCRAAGPRVL